MDLHKRIVFVVFHTSSGNVRVHKYSINLDSGVRQTIFLHNNDISYECSCNVCENSGMFTDASPVTCVERCLAGHMRREATNKSFRVTMIWTERQRARAFNL